MFGVKPKQFLEEWKSTVAFLKQDDICQVPCQNRHAGPSRDITMLTTRATKGRVLGTGEEFQIVDDYANPLDSHRMLANAWVGTCEMHE